VSCGETTVEAASVVEVASIVGAGAEVSVASELQAAASIEATASAARLTSILPPWPRRGRRPRPGVGRGRRDAKARL